RDERRKAGASGEIGIGTLCQQQRDGRRLLVLGGGEQRGAAVDIAGIDRRAAGQKQRDQLEAALAGGVSQRHGAARIARLDRSPLAYQLARQILTAAVGRGEQRG